MLELKYKLSKLYRKIVIPSEQRQKKDNPGPSTHSPLFLHIVSLQTEASISQ